MNFAKLFLYTNVSALAICVLSAVLFLNGTQFWYDLGRPLYLAYIAYFDIFWSLSYALPFFALWCLLRLYMLNFPPKLFIVNLIPLGLLVPLGFTACTNYFFVTPAVYIFVSIVVCIYTVKKVKSMRWSPEYGKSTLAIWYCWQAVIVIPALTSVMLVASFACYI